MNRTVSFSKKASNVFFHILTQCNLKCNHCYINPEQHGRQTLSISTIRRWLAALNPKGKTTNIVFLGGEPTLHPELAQAVREAKKMGYGSVTVDTNGYLFHDFLEKVTPDELDFISFSMDGATRETNDLIRGRGSHDICMAGIRKAVKSGFQTSMIYTVSRANLHELPDMIDVVRRLGIHRFFIQVIGIRGKSVQVQQTSSSSGGLQISASEWLDLIPEVASRIARIAGIPVTYPKVYLEPKEEFACAGNVADNYFIFPNGRVYRCPLCEDYALHSLEFSDNRLLTTPPLNEKDLFQLNIPEGCVMNRLIQPQNILYDNEGKPVYKIACCLLKEEVTIS